MTPEALKAALEKASANLTKLANEAIDIERGRGRENSEHHEGAVFERIGLCIDGANEHLKLCIEQLEQL